MTKQKLHLQSSGAHILRGDLEVESFIEHLRTITKVTMMMFLLVRCISLFLLIIMCEHMTMLQKFKTLPEAQRTQGIESTT